MGNDRWRLNDEEREAYILRMADHLPSLRAKIGISQEELARILGISRQTYSSAESHRKKISWQFFLTLVFFFDSMDATHEMLRELHIFPEELLLRFNGGQAPRHFKGGSEEDSLSNMIRSLDSQGRHALRTVLLVEYARCNNIPGDGVIRAFDGIDFSERGTFTDEERFSHAMNNLRERG